MIMLQGALQRAVEWEILVSNPIRHVRKPAPNRRRFVRPLAPEVVEQMRMTPPSFGTASGTRRC